MLTDQQPIAWIDGEPIYQELTQTTECPNCSGDGGFIDDNSEEGWQICGFCDGKAIVTFAQAEEWEESDPNLM